MDNTNQNAIRIVGPDGSMGNWFADLLCKIGLEVDFSGRTKKGTTNVPWIESVTLQRPQEIPLYLEQGYFDVAPVGQDWLANYDLPLVELMTIPVGRSADRPVRIVLAVPEDSDWTSVNDIPPMTVVATEYYELARRYFRSKHKKVKLIRSWGNTEHKVLYGAQAIVDVTETGNSLKENHLKIIETIMVSNMAIVANPDSLKNEQKAEYINHFVAMVKGTLLADKYVRIEANVPESLIEVAAKILGGLKGATISLVTTAGWISMTAYVPKNIEYQIIFDLTKIGVTDIAVIRQIPFIMQAE